MNTNIDTSKEILFASSDAVVSRKISQLEKVGTLKKIAPRIYTTNLLDSPESIVKRNLIDILAWRFPGAVISHRSANELRPTETGDFFITYTFNRKIMDIPGVRLNVLQGKPALNNDIPMGSLPIYIASEYRWMLENMQASRKSANESKSFSAETIEKRLEKMIHAGGEKKINAFRDEAMEVSAQLDMNVEFEKLNRIISALLSTHSADILSTPSGKAQSAGIPYDMDRAELFTVLYDALKERFFEVRPNKNITESSFRLFSFFESYFSNFIEGTKFDVEEAKMIVDTGIVIPKRVDDSHDILGTFKILSNRSEMLRVPVSESDLIDILKKRHAILLAGRPDFEPGIFKTRKNRAGNTEFVYPELVEGTLRFGFKLYTALTEPVAKAIYMMFLCAEVHPFNDGNGRIARIMMNAELTKGNQTRIIVPTVFREDYILSLRKLSRGKDPSTLIKVMERLQLFSDNLFGDDFDELNDYLKKCDAFEEPERGKLNIIERVFEKNASDFDTLN
ncbi:MAG: Fic family protein [Candidatus Symbiothrix sp.]|jgi:hypothetical protein|nr:Fic family protein [Candidatus Symbiothrix sp.]